MHEVFRSDIDFLKHFESFSKNQGNLKFKSIFIQVNEEMILSDILDIFVGINPLFISILLPFL